MCVVIGTHWRGISFSITPIASGETKVVVERPAPVAPPVYHRKPRPVAVPEQDETETSYQATVPRVTDATARIETAAPDDVLAQANIRADNSAPVAAPESSEPIWNYNVTVHPKKHRWPRRFFGAIGHGFGKVFGAR
jgi:hypothetical protein